MRADQQLPGIKEGGAEEVEEALGRFYSDRVLLYLGWGGYHMNSKLF